MTLEVLLTVWAVKSESILFGQIKFEFSCKSICIQHPKHASGILWI